MTKIVATEKGWKCIECGSIGTCYCDEYFPDPICDCGRLGWECRCNEMEEETAQEAFEQEKQLKRDMLLEIKLLCHNLVKWGENESGFIPQETLQHQLEYQSKRLADLVLKVFSDK